MFHPLAYDKRHRAYLARFTGTLTDQDIVASDDATKECLVLHGLTAGLLDFSHVEVCGLTLAQTVSRGLQPQIMAGQKRAIVADGVVFGMMRMFAAYQSSHDPEPMVVHTLAEAYEALGLVARNFHPVALSMPLAIASPADLSSAAYR